MDELMRQRWIVALSWEKWWSEGWIGPHVPPWTARTFPA
jgi:hypothetical protein